MSEYLQCHKSLCVCSWRSIGRTFIASSSASLPRLEVACDGSSCFEFFFSLLLFRDQDGNLNRPVAPSPCGRAGLLVWVIAPSATDSSFVRRTWWRIACLRMVRQVFWSVLAASGDEFETMNSNSRAWNATVFIDSCWQACYMPNPKEDFSTMRIKLAEGSWFALHRNIVANHKVTDYEIHADD